MARPHIYITSGEAAKIMEESVNTTIKRFAGKWVINNPNTKGHGHRRIKRSHVLQEKRSQELNFWPSTP